MLNRTKPSSHKAQRPQSFTALMKCVLLALPLAVLLGAFVLLLCTLLLSLTQDPIRYTDAAGIFCLYLTAALGGMLATRLYGRRAHVLCGFFSGVLLMLCLGVPSLFLMHPDTNAAQALMLRLMIPLASLAGALLFAKKRKARRRRATKRIRT